MLWPLHSIVWVPLSFLTSMRKTYDILVKQLGEGDSRTRDSQNWMKTFKMHECTKAKRPSFECSFFSKSYWYWYFEGTFGFFFLLICSGNFHLYPRWKGRDQISEPVLLDRCNCFPVLMLFSFFARSVSHSLYDVYNPYISGFVFLKTRSFYPGTTA